MPRWTFLTNHALVLSFLAKHPRITALELAQAIGIRERSIRKVIADLEAAGYIGKKREGRGNTYTVSLDMALRHETHQHVDIANFLETLARETPASTPRSRRRHTPRGELKKGQKSSLR